MPTKGVRLSPLAEQDLEDVWEYTFRTWSVEQADFYHSMIMAAVDGLASGDKIGRDASEVRAGYLKFSIGQHLLFYQDRADMIDVIRILHKRMDLPRHLL